MVYELQIWTRRASHDNWKMKIKTFKSKSDEEAIEVAKKKITSESKKIRFEISTPELYRIKLERKSGKRERVSVKKF